ncbi:MAG: hypothetical protein M1830_008911 [Pleopsidium flavum]|nr:MAG: hypothetical protein M1830_008911 [Pleopsidium flavum]
MINHFRDQMPRPLIGLGHSMGGCQLTNLALIHPRLLTTLILLDPVIQKHSSSPSGSGFSPGRASTFRRDLWPSRSAAAESFRKSKFYQAWDERVLDRWLQYGLRDLPTTIYPEDSTLDDTGKPVTLTTTKHQEVFTFLRPIFTSKDEHGKEAIIRLTHADFDPTTPHSSPFYRPEPEHTYHNLPFVRPSVLYIFGGLSLLSPPEWRKEKMELTGSGVGGSGGMKAGRVKEVVLENAGHLVAMEAVGACADATAEWLRVELKRWWEEEDKFNQEWSVKTRREKLMISEEWKTLIDEGLSRDRPARKGKL